MAVQHRYKDRILQYMEEHGIEVPVGARMRRSLNRYVAVKTHTDPPRMVAVTWQGQTDAYLYVKGLAFAEDENLEPSPLNIHVLDFKDRRKLVFQGGRSLRPVSEF